MLSAEHRRPLAAFFLVLAVAALIMTNGMRTQIVRQLISAGAPKSVIGALAPDMVLGQSLRHVAVRPEPTPQAIEKVVDQPVAGSGPSASSSSQQARSLPSIATVVQSVSPASSPAGKLRRGSSQGPAKTPVRAGTSPVTTSPVNTPTSPTSPTTPASGDPSSPTTPPKVTDELDGQGKHHLTEAELLARQAAKEARHEANRVAKRAAREAERVRQEEHRARVAERQAERERKRAEHRAEHQGDKVEKTVQITVKGLQGGVTHRDSSRGHGTRSSTTSHSSASGRHDQAQQDRAAQQHQAKQAKQDRAAEQRRAQQAKAAQQRQAEKQHQAKQDRAAKQEKAKQSKATQDKATQDRAKQDRAATRDERRDQHGSRGHRG